MPSKISGACQQCKENSARYRCPTCDIVYCTVACFKSHKETSCQPKATVKESINEPNKINNGKNIKPPLLFDDTEEEDRVPVDRLLALGKSKHLRNLLCNPHLRSMLTELDTSEKQSDLIREYMSKPIFIEFVDECLRIVEPDDNGNSPGFHDDDSDIEIIET